MLMQDNIIVNQCCFANFCQLMSCCAYCALCCLFSVF